jgi:hypothetical protein
VATRGESRSLYRLLHKLATTAFRQCSHHSWQLTCADAMYGDTGEAAAHTSSCRPALAVADLGLVGIQGEVASDAARWQPSVWQVGLVFNKS